ncbi:MAG: 5-(carboxyamino)imidazole ribonucleotide mutase [Gammaproteobacteria bacterium]|nr:5-(carboxyamino)imidazole ribonucleotide mutase [Gammaproteobacteria bacterium]
MSIVAGSKNDEGFLEPAFAVLRDFSITFEFKVLSAHRNTERLFEYIEDADARGVSIYLAAAGFSAALPGVVAAKTLRPVLGIPVPVGPLQGMDALLSIVQLPSGIPLAGMPLGNHGPKNAALFAAHILALHDDGVAGHVAAFRAALNAS